MEVVAFQIEKIVCGIPIDHVQEIKKVSEITVVHHAPEYVRGVINLRGQIVTVIDVRKKLHFRSLQDRKTMQVIVVHSRGEAIGLLVDDVNDVLLIEGDVIEPPPANIGKVEGYYFNAVGKMDDLLVAVLDVEKVLEETTEPFADAVL